MRLSAKNSLGACLIVSVLSAALSGCAHAPAGRDADPRALLHQACLPGSKVVSAKGHIWMKAASKDASGKFPANVEAKAPGSLRMEATNLLGGTEAIITVDGQEYSVQVPKQAGRSEKGSRAWAGIPLEWATDLFLGRIPCPASASERELTLTKTAEGDLLVEMPASLDRDAQLFRYRFGWVEGKPWPQSLHWERKSLPPLSVDFKFHDPEDKTLSPTRWEAKSAQGEVKVSWREREVR